MVVYIFAKIFESIFNRNGNSKEKIEVKVDNLEQANIFLK